MLSQIFYTGITLSILLTSCNSAPSRPLHSSAALVKRSNTLLGCDAKQTEKVNQALADMANLAQLAYDGASTTSLGFSHYFRDSELDVFKDGMSTIASNNDLTNPLYQFIVNCDPTDDIAKDCGKSYAITDATVPKDDNDIHTIWLCPLFFTGPDSARNLPAANDQDQLDAWCKQKTYTQYVTAGHILLHEITHLDAVAKHFPLDADPNTKEHGTIDYPWGSSPIRAARRLKGLVDKNPNDKNLLAPAYNAESYAGAATELWAQTICKKGYVPPQTGY